MQALDIQPTNPTPYTPVSGTYNNNPVPGAGGLPALSGLTRNVNPLASQLQEQGRGQDSMLVHMTPNEVNSLQGLAMAHGGSLTVNPNTGLPEAGFLSKILPIVAGIAGSFVGIPPWVTAAAVGGVTGVASGDLNKGLMAGLGAYGGASLGGALKGIGSAAGAGAAGSGITTAENTWLTQMGGTAVPAVTNPASSGILGKFGTDFATAAREGIKAGTLPSKFAPMAAGLGLTSSVGEALQPKLPTYEKPEDKWKYEGPYMAQPRRVHQTVSGPSEISYFEDTNPYPGYVTAAGNAPTGFAEGGEASKQAAPAAAALPEMIKMFQTSPGPITASRTYPGGSPSELIRAAAKANAAKPAAEMDYGFAKTAGTNTGINIGPGVNDYSTYITDIMNKYGYGTGTSGSSGGSTNVTGSSVKDPTPTNIFMGENPRNTSAGDVVTTGTTPTYTPPAYVPPTTPTYTPPAYVPPTTPTYTPPITTAPPVAPPDIFTPTYDYTNIPTADYSTINDYIAQSTPGYRGGLVDITGPTMEYAKGGVHMDDGAFVVDARTVSELGNGSSSAGQELLARLGGRPVKGPGDGVSDSIPANIGGTQEARVARDEVIFPAEAVRKLGGAKKLYALMDKAHAARKKAGRGTDTKLRKGLKAL